MRRFIPLFCLCIVIGALLACGESSNTTSSASTNSTNSATTDQTIHYPPTTVADLHGLASKGDANAIHEFHSESVGLPSCPQPKREVTVDPSITDQQLAEDLLAYFYAQNLDSPCGSVIFAYHSQDEAGNGYTAGRVLLDVTGSSHTLTLNIGDVPTGKGYTVTY